MALDLTKGLAKSASIPTRFSFHQLLLLLAFLLSSAFPVQSSVLATFSYSRSTSFQPGTIPDGYREVTDAALNKIFDNPDDHDKLVKEIAKHYLDEKCRVFVPTAKAKKEAKNADLIIVCWCDRDKKEKFVAVIEVKSGTTGVEKAPTQIEEGVKAAQKSGLIPDKWPKDQFDQCFHSIVYAPGELTKPGKLDQEENKTKINGDQKKSPKRVKKIDDLPKPPK